MPSSPELSVTLDQIFDWEPCYPESQIRWLAEGFGRDRITARDALDLPIPAVDRLWLVLRPELISEPILHEFACRCAETALDLVESLGWSIDSRLPKVIEVKRSWLQGNASLTDLKNAWEEACSVASSAAMTTAGSTTESTAGSTTGLAARLAAGRSVRTASMLAARSASCLASWSAAESAAWSAACSAACSADRSSSWWAAWSAAHSASWSAACSAAEEEAQAAQIEILRTLLADGQPAEDSQLGKVRQ